MQFQYGLGSVIGRDHRSELKNRQDADSVIQTNNRFIGIIADGCGDPTASSSEYGATFGASVLAKTIFDLSARVNPQKEMDIFGGHNFWDRVEQDVLAHLRTNALLFEGSFQATIVKYFLFTSLGVLITPNVSVFFGIGDGNIFVNGDRIQIGPFKENAPPYLAYRLLVDPPKYEPGALQFKVFRILPTKELKNFLVGCDGTNYIIENEESLLPGRTDKVGPISQFWVEDKYFTNPVAIELRLRVISEDKQQIDWENRRLRRFAGHLKDDTTILVGRFV